MKKIIFFFSIIGIVIFNSFYNNAKANTQNSFYATTVKPNKKIKVPKFSDPEVQEYANEYAEFIYEYIDAVKNKDTAKLTELGTNAQKFATKAASVAKKLEKNPEDAKIFTEFAQKISKEVQDISMNPN